jgi:Domain of unknown function (DUF1707)
MDVPSLLSPTAIERDRVVDAMKAAVSDGRLTVPEFEVRLNAVYSVSSHADLDAVLHSFPPPGPPQAHLPVWMTAAAVLGVVGILLAAAVGIAALHHRTPDRTLVPPISAPALTTPNAPSNNDDSGGSTNTVGPPHAAVIRASCMKSVPLSAMRTAWLNLPVRLATPSAANAASCFAVAGLSTTAPHSGAIHVHVDFNMMGGVVVLPRGIGVDPANGARTQIYTDNNQGVVTVDANGTYTLGQLFYEWGHPLTSQAIGNLRLLPDDPVYWFVNGKHVTNAAAIPLRNHEEIEGFEDLRGAKINPTSSYAFPPGY